MRTLTFTEIINQSVEHTRNLLLRPFNLRKWLLFWFIAALAGGLGGGGCNLNSSIPSPGESQDRKQSAVASKDAVELPNSQDTASAPVTDASQSTPAASQAPAKPPRFEDIFTKEAFQDFVKKNVTPFWGWWVFGILLILSISLFFTWLGCRFYFIWLNAVIFDDTKIRVPFRDYAPQARSLFGFVGFMWFVSLVFVVLCVVSIVMLVMAFMATKQFSAGMIALIVILSLLAIVLMITIGVLNVFVEHFVGTIMFMDRCTFAQAWARMVGIYQQQPKDFWQYLGCVILASIALGIVVTIAVILFMLALALVGLVLAGILYLMFMVALKSKTIFMVLLIPIVCVLVIALIIGSMLSAVPVGVFFKTFSLKFLGSLQCGYNPLSMKQGGSDNPQIGESV